LYIIKGAAMMTTSFANPSVYPEPTLTHLKAAFLEPVLVVAAALFWVLALPVVATWLVALKIWEVVVALSLGNAVRPNPLILRYGPLKGRAAREIAPVAQV
jgi:hypothetical protein